MAIPITGKLEASAGKGAFKLTWPEEFDTGNIDVAMTLIAGGQLKVSGILGEIVPQTGAIVPVHSATEGTLYWDTVANKFYVNNNGTTGWTEIGAGGGASQLSDLTDVNVTTPTAGNVLRADGVDWESAKLASADLSDAATINADTVDGSHASAFESAGAVATHAALTATHGVSGAIVGTSSAQELTNKTIDASQLTGTIAAARMQEVLALADLSDVTAKTGSGTVAVMQNGPTLNTGSGDPALLIQAAGSTNNYFKIVPSVSGASPDFEAVGSDANINIDLLPKGTGRVRMGTTNIPTISSTDTLTNKSISGEQIDSGTLPIARIADGAVTLAKLANLAQDQFIGRVTASTGVPETATITAAARTVLDDTTVAAMVDTLGGASATGTGGIVRATSPTLVTPVLGTPAAGSVLTNCTGLPPAGATAALKRKLLVAYDTITAAPTATDVVSVPIPDNYTVTHIYAFSTGGTITFKVEKRASGTPYTAGTAVVTAGNTTTADAQLKVTSFDSAGVTADQWLTINITAVSGATKCKVAVWGTPD